MITWTPEPADLDWLEVLDWAEVTKAVEAALKDELPDTSPMHLLFVEAWGNA